MKRENNTKNNRYGLSDNTMKPANKSHLIGCKSQSFEKEDFV